MGTGNPTKLASRGTFTDFTWHTVVASRSGTQARLLVDNIEQSVVTVTDEGDNSLDIMPPIFVGGLDEEHERLVKGVLPVSTVGNGTYSCTVGRTSIVFGLSS